MRIWSNSSQVEEKKGSFVSLLNGTRPEHFLFQNFQFQVLTSFHSIHLFEDELVLGSSWLLVSLLFEPIDMWLMFVVVPTANRLCQGCCNQEEVWSARSPSPQPTEQRLAPKPGHHRIPIQLGLWSLLACSRIWSNKCNHCDFASSQTSNLRSHDIYNFV